MTPTNYIAIRLTREQRDMAGVSIRELMFPFDSDEPSSVTDAKTSADEMMIRLGELGIHAQMRTWRLCRWLALPVIVTDSTHRTPHKSDRDNPRKHKWLGGRIGEVRQ